MRWEFECCSCDQKYKIDDKEVGLAFKCTKCDTYIYTKFGSFEDEDGEEWDYVATNDISEDEIMKFDDNGDHVGGLFEISDAPKCID
jgi:hypothetical protein